MGLETIDRERHPWNCLECGCPNPSTAFECECCGELEPRPCEWCEELFTPWRWQPKAKLEKWECRRCAEGGNEPDPYDGVDRDQGEDR